MEFIRTRPLIAGGGDSPLTGTYHYRLRISYTVMRYVLILS